MKHLKLISALTILIRLPYSDFYYLHVTGVKCQTILCREIKMQIESLVSHKNGSWLKIK